MREALSECEKKIKEAKEQYHQALIINLKKDAVIRQLKENLKKSKFDKYRESLGDDTIVELDSLSTSCDKDSTFVATILKALYKNNLLALKTMTYSGRGTNKQKLPQKDIDILKIVFTERLNGQTDFDKRNANLSKHIKAAIESVNKTNANRTEI